MKSDSVSGGRRPVLHFSPAAGWMNDPNGLCFFGGSYHMFFQYNPYANHWDKMHWGHAVSNDLISWQELPAALYPDQWYEDDAKGGCFSGSALVSGDTLYLVYTAVAGGRQRQCLATSRDGVSFEKHPANPLVEMPDGYTDFRDPKVFCHDGSYYMVVGASDGKHGFVDLYRSSDLVSWQSLGHLHQLSAEEGNMAECPDFFELDGRWVLTYSPMGYSRNGAPVMAAVGDMDFERNLFAVRSLRPLDYGSDFYAFQSFLLPSGERCGIAWANMWEWMGQFRGFWPDPSWQCFMTIPRRMRCVGDRVCSYPVDSLWTGMEIAEEEGPSAVEGTFQSVRCPSDGAIAVSVSIEKAPGDAPLEIDVVQGGERLVLVADSVLEEAAVTIWKDGVLNRKAVLSAGGTEGDIALDIIVDECSVEVFFCKGKASAAFNMFNNGSERSIEYRSLGRRSGISSMTVARRKR